MEMEMAAVMESGHVWEMEIEMALEMEMEMGTVMESGLVVLEMEMAMEMEMGTVMESGLVLEREIGMAMEA